MGAGGGMKKYEIRVCLRIELGGRGGVGVSFLYPWAVRAWRDIKTESVRVRYWGAAKAFGFGRESVGCESVGMHQIC